MANVQTQRMRTAVYWIAITLDPTMASNVKTSAQKADADELDKQAPHGKALIFQEVADVDVENRLRHDQKEWDANARDDHPSQRTVGPWDQVRGADVGGIGLGLDHATDPNVLVATRLSEGQETKTHQEEALTEHKIRQPPKLLHLRDDETQMHMHVEAQPDGVSEKQRPYRGHMAPAGQPGLARSLADYDQVQGRHQKRVQHMVLGKATKPCPLLLGKLRAEGKAPDSQQPFWRNEAEYAEDRKPCDENPDHERRLLQAFNDVFRMYGTVSLVLVRAFQEVSEGHCRTKF
eukprot:CAMPEP_0117607520 /NCGR_PEP_ID=MMETSP0784-20121206/80306_1 /TAXON_ID=39447 /ORGANISM="" /LENGTH=290 /DNA_ID=CAMNT_0005410707 /DNA_START=264 /DNA_END=1132 /DNA_ORIENTATION=+